MNFNLNSWNLKNITFYAQFVIHLFIVQLIGSIHHAMRTGAAQISNRGSKLCDYLRSFFPCQVFTIFVCRLNRKTTDMGKCNGKNRKVIAIYSRLIALCYRQLLTLPHDRLTD